MALTIVAFCYCMISLSAQNDKYLQYIPSDQEIQTYMNLYNQLKAFEDDKFDIKQLGKLYSTLQSKNNYGTYQRILFESYLISTKNAKIKKYMTDYLSKNAKRNDEFAKVLIRLYKSKEEKYKKEGHDYIRYISKNERFDENINLFDMNEVLVLDKSIGVMLFENNWSVLQFSNPEDKNEEKNKLTLLYGGGTNSLKIKFKKTENIILKNLIIRLLKRTQIFIKKL